MKGKPELTFPLNLAVAGQRVVLVGYDGNGRTLHRLAELGLTPDTEITVVRSTRGQPMILSARASRLAIDQDTARRLRVRIPGPGGDFPCDHRSRRRRWRWRFRPRRRR
jgi:Fe2+ transport system protein FeoA